MRLATFLSLFLMVFALSSCGDEESQTGDLKLNFKLKYGDQPLVMFEPYNYPTGQKMIFSRFSFYLGDTQLKSGSSYTGIEEISYHNLTNSHTGAAAAAKGYDHTITGIKAGNYTSLKFALGVPKVNNDKSPADFSNSHVLSNQSEYWSGWKSYVFTKTEGQIDLDGDGTTETGFALHTGANDALRIIELPVNLTISEGKETTLNIFIDVKKEFGSNPVYDIETHPQIHSISQAPQVKQLIDNLATAFSMQ